MKIIKQILSVLLVILSVGIISGQPVVLFNDITLTPQSGTSHRTKWEVVDNSNLNLRNGQVATLRAPNSSTFEPFDTRIRGFSSAVIRFNTCVAVGKTFTAFWNTYNWGGANVGNGNFTITVLPPPVGQLTPTFAFSSINGSCNQVTLCVNNPLPGATYAWNGTIPGSCAQFNAPAPAQIQVVATCGGGPGSVAPFTQTPPPPPFDPGVSIDQGNFITICEQEQLFLNATSLTCINSPNNWVWSSSGGSIFNQSVSSGSTASAFFSAQPGFYTVTINTIDFQGKPAEGIININVLSQSDPQCNIFFLKQSAEKPMVTATDEKKMEGIDSNTAGSNENAKMDINNKLTIKQGIYPNPANEVLNVGGVQGVQTIEVVDLNGKVIKTVSIGENEVSRALNVSNLSGGIYILKKVKRDGQLEATKFQVIH